MTEEQWYNHPSLRQDLEALLSNKVLATALEIVKDKGMRSTSFPTTPCDLMQFFALMGAKKDGYLEGLKNLYLLTQTPPAPKPEVKPWETKRKPTTAE